MKDRKCCLRIRLLACCAVLGPAVSCARTDKDDHTMPPLRAPAPVIVFFGDSLTEGFDLPARQAYPALIQKRLRAAGLPYRVINAGVSGDTAADGLARADQALASKPDVLVAAFGTNDLGRGVPPQAFSGALQRIIDLAKAANPEVKIAVAGVDIPQHRKLDEFDDYQAVFQKAAADNGALLIPNILDGVAGVAALNLPDGLHPNAAGHRVMAERMWERLQPLIKDGVKQRH